MAVERLGWLCVVVCSSAALTLAAFLFVYANGLDSGQNQAVAAWVQAVGSIVAIVGAVWGVVYQSGISRRDARIGYIAVIEATEARAKQILDALRSDDVPFALGQVYHPLVMQSIQNALAGIPAQALPSKEGVIAFFSMQTQFSQIAKPIEALMFLETQPMDEDLYALMRSGEVPYEKLREITERRDRMRNGNLVRQLLRIESDCETVLRHLR